MCRWTFRKHRKWIPKSAWHYLQLLSKYVAFKLGAIPDEDSHNAIAILQYKPFMHALPGPKLRRKKNDSKYQDYAL